MRKLRKGFTLVELLIVISIIGALAVSMTLSVKDQTPKAQAARVISDFKILKTAIILYNIDSKDSTPTVDYFNAHSGDYLAGKLKQYTVELSNDVQWLATYTGGLSAAAWSNLDTDAGDLGIASTDNGLRMRVY